MTKEVQLVNDSRREFLKYGITSGTGLTLSLYFPTLLADELASDSNAASADSSELEPNAFVRISPDDSVTVIVKHIEFGQGTYTGLPTLVAEELDAAWSQIKVEAAPADAARYNNLAWGPFMGTGGSTAIRNSYEQMRNAGATARSMLISAAAKLWDVKPKSITIEQGIVTHKASNQTTSFGKLVEIASKLPVPKKVKLKKAEEFVYIGKQSSRIDSVAKTNGTAMYTQDIKLPNMQVAVVAHPPKFGATVKSFNTDALMGVKGVEKTVQLPNGVAVLAKDFWTAKKARDLLTIEWDESNAFKLSSDEIMAEYKLLAKKPGSIAHENGDVEKAFGNAKHIVTANYEFPFLAHAALEPMNCIVQLSNDSCELWYGAQLHSGDLSAVSKATGLPADKIKINTLYAGGSFGRRASSQSDYVLEAVEIAKAAKLSVPIKMVWTREDDMLSGYYRPSTYHNLSAAIDNEGKITAWKQRIVGQSVMSGTSFAGAFVKDGVDQSTVEGLNPIAYAIPNQHIDMHIATSPVPVLWWRSVGHTHTGCTKEAFLDEIAHKTNKDPVELRRELLKKQPRHLGVLNLAVEKANWGSPLGKNRGRGVAVHKSFHSYVAQVAEITVNEDRSFSVDRVVIAVDCGISINPDIIRAQMEGGMGYGLSAALSGAITFKEGAVVESNFDGYQVLRMNQMPEVEVHIVESSENPTGVGEPGTPPIIPAVINALADATGKFHHILPLPRTV